jgi:hypothetical protein
MMEKPVPHARLVNIPRLRVGNIECIIATMNIGFVFEVSMKSKDVVG